MSEQTTQEQAEATPAITPEILAQAKKLIEKRQKNGTDAMTNALKYPGVIPGSIVHDTTAQKFMVKVKCVECGEVHSRYTSDLFQTFGLCPTCRKDKAKELKTVKKELLKKAMEAIRKGQIA